MSRMIALVTLIGLLSAGPVAAQAQKVTVTPDVVYGHKYGMALTFDVFTPADANGAAVLNMVAVAGARSGVRTTCRNSGIRRCSTPDSPSSRCGMAAARST